MNHDKHHRPEITIGQQMLSSCTGALITSVVVTPLDVVKIRMQAQQKEFLKNKCFLYCNGLMDHICYCNGASAAASNGAGKWFKRPVHFSGTFDGILKIARSEGISSLWSGLPPTLVMAIPATVVYFTIYDEIRKRLGSLVCQPSNAGDIPLRLPLWVPMVSGGSARVLSATLISPLELLRTKMQSRPLTYGQLVDAVRQLLAVEGFRGLYKGLTATILRDVPFSCIYWAGYEWLRAKMSPSSTPPSFSVSFIAGACSGSLAAVLTLPFDVVKTHRQIELGEKLVCVSNTQQAATPQRTDQLLRHIYQRRGFQGLFTGLTPRVIKVAPACAIMISTYEMGKSFFARRNAVLTEQ